MVVAYQNQVVMEETLDAGLARLFGGSAAAKMTSGGGGGGRSGRFGGHRGACVNPCGAPDAVAEARNRYQAALAAQRAGDWAKYGEEIRKLGEVLSGWAGGEGR